MKKITSKKEAKRFIETISTQKGTLKSKLNDALKYEITSNKYRTHETIGTGRFSKQQEKKSHSDLQFVLQKLNVNYTYENDAPKGGKLGEYILIKDKKFLELIKNENILQEIKKYLGAE